MYFLACCCLQAGIFVIAGGAALFMQDILNKLATVRNKIGHDVHVCEIYELPKEIFKSLNSTEHEAVVS